MEERLIRSARYTGLLALAALAVWAYLAWTAPVEKVQGVIQKIMYVHVPNVGPAYLGFVLTAVGGIGFLATRREAWDRFALASAEVGVVFCSLILLSGPLWAKPAWGVWWVWDLRLTSTVVLWFIYVAYLFLRAFAAGSTLHPTDPSRQGLPPGIAAALRSGMVAFLLIFAWLVARRLGVARLEALVEEHRS
ncbi:MAG: cytochrome c biogenesis protein CcsA [Deltaproteobacteria bacterium]|nr:cytochrome c biogenesis protein CcsA [Deltaproteobacteria bacterium]